MPYTEEEKRNIILNNGLDPEKYVFNENTSSFFPKTSPVISTPERNPANDVIGSPVTKPSENFSTLGTLARHGAASVVPTAGGIAGGIGLPALALLAAPETGGLSLAALGLAGAFGGGYLANKAQEPLLTDKFKQELAQSAQEHPYAAITGELAPSAVAFNPLQGLKELPTLASGVSKIPAALRAGGVAKTLLPQELNALQNAAVNVGASTGQEVYNQSQSNEPFSLGQAAARILPSLILNEPNSIGKRLGFHSTADIRGLENQRQQILAENQSYTQSTEPLAGRYNPDVGVGDVAPYDVAKSATRRDAEAAFQQDTTNKQKEYALAQQEERNAQLKEALRIRDENERLRAELGKEGTQPLSDNSIRITKPSLEDSLRGLPKQESAGVPETDNTRAMQQSAEENRARPLTEAELIQEHADKFPEQYSQSAERPLLLSDLTPQQREHLNAHQEALAANRGFVVDRPQRILDAEGNSVAGVNPNQPNRTVQVSETKGGPGTVPHETGGHGFVNDLLKSSDPKDVKLAQRGLELFKSHPEGAPEGLAKAFEKAAFYRDFGDLYGGKLQKFKSWLGDVTASTKTRLGLGNEKDVIRHLNARYNNDSPYYSRFELPLEPIPRDTGTTKRVPTTTQAGFAGGYPQYSKVAFQPEEIHKMTGEQFYKAMHNVEGGLTGEAIRVGLQAKTPEQQSVLQEGRTKAESDFKEAMAKKDFNSASYLASKGQYFREALEAARGTGGVADFLKKQGIQFSKWSDLKLEDLKHLKQFTGLDEHDLKRIIDKEGNSPEGTKVRREMTMLKIMDEKGLMGKGDEGHKEIYNEARKQAMDEIEKVAPSEGKKQYSKESQINSEDFKKWFRDSKVVDKEGKPLELFHGTNNSKDFTSFDTNKRAYTYGRGSYFTPEKSRASEYSGGLFRKTGDFPDNAKVIPVYVSLKNPFVVSSDASVSDLGHRLYENNRTEYNRLAEKVKKIMGYVSIEGMAPVEVGNELLREKGYDGIIKKWNAGTKYESVVEVVAFKPEQIKSSIGNKGTFDSNNPNIQLSKESAISIPGFRGEIEKISRLENPEAPKLAKALAKTLNDYDSNIGKYKNGIIRELKDTLGIRAKDSLKSYVSQNNESSDRVRQYRDDINDYGASSIKLTPEEKKAVTQLNNAIRVVGEERNKREGLHQGELRPEEYFMNTPSSKVIDIMSNDRTSPEGQKLIKDFIKYQLDNNPEVTTRDQALDQLKVFMAGYNKKGVDIASQFGPLDKSEGIGIPQSWREPNLLERVGRYMDRVARRLAYYDNIESKPDIQKALTDPVTGLDQADPVKNVIGRITGVRPQAEVKRDSAGRLVRSLMLGTLTGVKDMVSNPFLGWQHQTPRQALLVGVKRWQNLKENLADSFLTGVNRENIGSLEFGDDVIPWIRKVADVASDVSGRNLLEKLNRATAFGEGKWLVLDNFANFKKGDISTQGKKFMTDFAPEGWETKTSLSPEDINAAAAGYAKSIQGHYNHIGLPNVAVEGSLAPVLSLARWNIEKTNNFFEHVITPAVKQGNFTPLLMSTLGMFLGGEAVNQIAQLISNKKEKTPTVSEVLNTDEGQLKAFGYKAAGLASLSGYAGMLGDISKAVGDMAFKNKPQGYNNLLVETAGNVIENTHNLVTALKDGDLNLGLDFISKILEDNIQSYRLILNHPGLYSAIAPETAKDRSEQLDRQNKFRDFKTFRNLYDYPVSDINQTIPNVFADQKEKEFKRTSDISKALELRPEIISKAIEKGDGDSEKIKKNLEGLKGNSYQTMPKPDNSPLEFQKYMNYVRQTQGDQAALSLLVDYVRQNALNQAKSGMLP